MKQEGKSIPRRWNILELHGEDSTWRKYLIIHMSCIWMMINLFWYGKVAAKVRFTSQQRTSQRRNKDSELVFYRTTKCPSLTPLYGSPESSQNTASEHSISSDLLRTWFRFAKVRRCTPKKAVAWLWHYQPCNVSARLSQNTQTSFQPFQMLSNYPCICSKLQAELSRRLSSNMKLPKSISGEEGLQNKSQIEPYDQCQLTLRTVSTPSFFIQVPKELLQSSHQIIEALYVHRFMT